MKIRIWGIGLLAAISCQAGTLPDNFYFQAMQDEMQRTKKELRVEGSARPFYLVYQVKQEQHQRFYAELGVLEKNTPLPQQGLEVSVYMYAGNRQQNSSGFLDNYYPFYVSSGRSADSYEALRHALWQITDREYIKAANVAEKKTAYKRRKNMLYAEADFSVAPRACIQDKQVPFVLQPSSIYGPLVQELSAAGLNIPYIEDYTVSVNFQQENVYFLDSEENCYQGQRVKRKVRFWAEFRNQDGYVEKKAETFSLPEEEGEIVPFIREKSTRFLEQINQLYQANKVKPYVGPVLFEPQAAGGFLKQFFVDNIRFTKPLLSAQNEMDRTAGVLREKVGMRVMSPFLDIFDKPNERTYNGEMLAGFMPVDAEGVAAQPLHVVEKGKLKVLPTIRSLIPGQKQSNGHAKLAQGSSGMRQYPRAGLSNVFVESSQTSSAEELEQRLLQRCRELGLEYGYIFHTFPVITAQRIYVEDGRKEPVYGIDLQGMNTRSLRDIVAAGDQPEVVSYDQTAIITPAMLVDEIEIMPTQRQPDRKPFVPLPQ